MRVPALSAGLVLGSAFLAVAGLTMMAPSSQTKANPPKIAMTKPAPAKVKCPCDCPPEHHVRHVAHRVHRLVRHYAHGAYDYRRAEAYREDWRAAPRNAYAEQEGLTIDRYGWTGGVGYGAEGGGGGGGFFFANGNQNGPTYNSYGESFQPNPSMAHPFQNRSMGGLAPRSGGK